VSLVSGGYQASRISTHYVERVVAAEAKELRQAIRGQTYTLQGHQHYLMSGTTFTLDYDFSTGAWLDRSTEGMSRWRAEHAIAAFGTVLAGDVETGRVYEVTNEEPNDDDRPIVMRVALPPVQAFPAALVCYDLRANVVTGVGSRKAGAPSVDADPVIKLRWSDDGGASWSPYRIKKLGKRGTGSDQIYFPQLGQTSAKGRTFELSMSASVDRGIAGVSATLAQVANP
jgi:hypothetical protein